MQAILDFILFFTLLSLTTNPQFMLANLQHPDNGLRGNESDYEALLAIKSEISGDPLSVLSSWNNSLHFCRWEGVTCGRKHQRRVVSLDLYSSNLVGTLSPFVGNLSFLHLLNLYNNFFRGDIPHQISRLSRLQNLVLANNSFEGEIPPNLSRCLNLRLLGLNSNNLVGKIPNQLATLPNLKVLNLYQNNLSGNLKDIGIGNMSTSLQVLYLGLNHLEGSIPDDIGRLKGLVALAVNDNALSGTIPTSMFNLSNLKTLSLSRNNIHGHLPHDFGLRLPRLSYFLMGNTFLTGQVPTSLSNLSELVLLDISFNSFMGKFSINGNNLPHLSILAIHFAFSLGGEPRDMNFLDTLTNCTNLAQLVISGNSFTGSFPHSILNISTSLEDFDLGSNQIFGQIPLGLGKFVNLDGLGLADNHLTGPIPHDIGKLERMQALDFSSNNLSGEIPSSLGNLTVMSLLYMGNNNLQGSLPKTLGNCKSLLRLSLTSNNFSGSFPNELLRGSNLISLLIGQNNFQGPFPLEISSLKNLDGLDVSHNRFSGEILNALGDCTSLTFLVMNQNSFVGSIPESLSPLKSIQYLDLSCNNLSGQIPNYFSTWPYLLNLNLSFNNLDGEVPSNGIFANASAVSLVGNNKLCGGLPRLHLPRCPKPKRRRLSFKVIMIISITCALIGVLSVALCFYFLCSSRKRKDPPSEPQSIRPFLEVSYQMLHMATNGFSLSNLLGVGGFGSVYKGILHQDDTELVVAVKVMNLHNEGASKSFIAECKALRNIRHRNLVKIITACSSIDNQRNDFKALVYEFIPRGNLEDWLHSSNLVPVASEHVDGSLSLFHRLSIAIDVASALEYLHIECANPIIHCDLKPSNILLDDEMTAHVGDFGLAKFLSGGLSSTSTNQTSSNQVRGTVGYTTPEYGTGSKVSLEGDMYSFEIIVLELMTSKKPTDPMFNDGLNLHDFAKAALPSRVMEIVDPRMYGDADVLRARNGADIKKMECIKSLVMIGVKCSLEVPQERMKIKDVVNELKSTRKNLLVSRG